MVKEETLKELALSRSEYNLILDKLNTIKIKKVKEWLC